MLQNIDTQQFLCISFSSQTIASYLYLKWTTHSTFGQRFRMKKKKKRGKKIVSMRLAALILIERKRDDMTINCIKRIRESAINRIENTILAANKEQFSASIYRLYAIFDGGNGPNTAFASVSVTRVLCLFSSFVFCIASFHRPKQKE